ncbi:MAG: hypothetical protein H6Q05_2045 [Acidobacteria bacterium]|nr:hypothetical protein [Acidobacteriota bacterium]
MRNHLGTKSVGWLFGALLACTPCLGQDLTPRAYLITPIRSNAIIMTDSFFSGNLMFNGTVPITDSTANLNAPIFSLYHSFSFFGRSANITASLPYGVGHFKGTVMGSETTVYRSGMFDSIYRIAVNLKGGPAMDVSQFMKYQQKTVIGVSLKLMAPTGQYDPQRLINLGSNRWAFKPEVGYSRRLGHWVLDGYGGVWLYTRNAEFFSRNAYVPDVQEQTQEPILALEGHLSYDVKPRLWVSLDGNFWYGGRTSLNGVQNPATLQQNSRLGGTGSIPITRRQSIKMSYSHGTYVRFGGNFHNLSVAWQYSWIRQPK